MNLDKIVINAISLLSKLTGIDKYTFEVSKNIMQLNPGADFNFFYGIIQLGLVRDEPSITFSRGAPSVNAALYHDWFAIDAGAEQRLDKMVGPYCEHNRDVVIHGRTPS